MEKIKDLKVLIKEKQAQDKVVESSDSFAKITNPIIGQIKKNLVQFKNSDLSKKFDINDLLR